MQGLEASIVHDVVLDINILPLPCFRILSILASFKAL